MQQVAIVYAIIAWLACWLVDLIVIVVTRPIYFDTLAKLIIVLVCLLIILFQNSRNRWLF